MPTALFTPDRPAEIRARIRHRALATLYDYWRALAPEGMPRRRDFDPVGLPGEVWPRLYLVKTGPRVEECQLRVLGTYIVAAYGRDFTGRHCNDGEIPRFSVSNTAGLLDRLLREPAARHHFGKTSFRFFDDYRTCEQVLLPLADDTGRLCAAIGAVDFPSFCGARD
jgi:hypothetical protein